nr:13063_t:CDS:2 [Entrophospora candida]
MIHYSKPENVNNESDVLTEKLFQLIDRSSPVAIVRPALKTRSKLMDQENMILGLLLYMIDMIFPNKIRTIEDLKERYYSVCKKILQIKPSQPGNNQQDKGAIIALNTYDKTHSKVEAIIPIHTRCEKFPIGASVRSQKIPVPKQNLLTKVQKTFQECGLGYLPTVPTESVCDLKKNLEKQENELKTKQVTLQKAKSSIIDSSNFNNSLTNGSKSPRSNKKLRS